MPTLVANCIPPGVEITLHSENGMLGVGRARPMPRSIPTINAGKETVTDCRAPRKLSSADSFAMVRGGHIDVTVLGALESTPKQSRQLDDPGKMVRAWRRDGPVAGGKRVVIAGARKDGGLKEGRPRCRRPA